MRIAISRRKPTPVETEPVVVEVVTPRTNAAALTSAENFFASMALAEFFSVELAADCNRRRFLVRASSGHMREQLLSQLSAAYPQADLRPVQAEGDPARTQEGEQVAACTLELRAPPYLPLRTFTDLDLDGERAAQADPLLGVLSALGDLRPDWRGLSQVVLQAAPEDWGRDYQRFAVQHPLERERVPRANEGAGPLIVFLALLLAAGIAGLEAYELLLSGQWLQLGGLLAIAAAVGAGVLRLMRRLSRTTVYDMDLVREKVTRIAFRAEVRLLIFAPASCTPAAVRLELERIATAYRRFNLAAGNGFVARHIQPDKVGVRSPAPWRSSRKLAVLTTLELAGVWHLPHAAADVALLERTTARHWLPLPQAVARGCRIGTSRHQGREVPVALPADVLRRHLLLVAKTRRGKSTLIQRLAHSAMEAEPRRAVLLVDPHRDLGEATLGLVPGNRSADVVYLNVADGKRPFGLNLLDTGLGWDRDRAVANTLAVFQREWGDRFWGPRMEDAFRFALMSLFEANIGMCRADPVHGRAAQYTLLELPIILSDAAFRREALHGVSDPSIRAWWSEYFEPLDRRFQQELVNPVLSKIHRFEGSAAGRRIVGQPVSTVDPVGWLRDGKIVIVNTARGDVGENTAALIGSTLLNLVTLAVAEQARLEARERRAISIYVDEFHAIPGADYEAILAELSKFGANLVLATQSLARLLALGRDEGRGLRATVFANLDGLFAFNCSAEDAEYLVPELGGAIDEQDLVELGEHQCYVRMTSRGQRLPTFSVYLDPPLSGDPELGRKLAAASAERYGRDAERVEADRRARLTHLMEAKTRALASIVVEPPKSSARNEHRPRKKRKDQRPPTRAAEAASAT